MGGLADDVRVSGAEASREPLGTESHRRLRSLDAVPANVVGRLGDELGAALKRKPANEPLLAGALRALLPHSEPLREIATSELEVLVRRGSFERPLYAAMA